MCSIQQPQLNKLDLCRRRFNPWVGKIPWRREQQPTPVFLPGKSHGQRSLVGYSPRVTKSRTRLKRLSSSSSRAFWASLVAESKESACNAGDLGWILGWEDPLEKGTATHSSILAWKIPWMEEPGRLQSSRPCL